MKKKSRQMVLDSFESVMEEKNPFGFKKKDGKVMLFDSYKEAYYYTMKKLWEMFPKGYVDLCVFINEMTGMPLEECETVVSNWHVKGMLFEPYLWDVQGMQMSIILKEILTCLHMITETPLDNEAFQIAYGKIRNKIINETKNKRL